MRPTEMTKPMLIRKVGELSSEVQLTIPECVLVGFLMAVAALLVVIFIDTPDLHDAVMHHLQNTVNACATINE